MSKRILGVDMDNVIVDYTRHFIVYVNELYGRNFKATDFLKHDLANITDQLRISMEEFGQAVRNFEQTELFAKLPPINGALESLEILSETYEITIITSRKSSQEEATRIWLNDNLPGVAVHYGQGRGNSFAGGVGRLPKPELAEQIGVIALIDDNEQEFFHWNSKTVEQICFAQPWNRGLAITHPHIPRYNWDEIVKHFCSNGRV